MEKNEEKAIILIYMQCLIYAVEMSGFFKNAEVRFVRDGCGRDPRLAGVVLDIR